MMLLIQLFFRFAQIGLFAIGGGLATLPFLYDLMDRTGWYTMEDVTNMIAVSESTPGPLGVNMATYVGNVTGGVLGGVVATIGLIAPSIIVIILVSKILEKFRESQTVKAVFYGLRPASMAMIASAGLLVARQAFLTGEISRLQDLKFSQLSLLFNWKAMFFAALLWILMTKYKKHPIFYILFAAALGIVFQM